jgi:hypothetical protein
MSKKILTEQQREAAVVAVQLAGKGLSTLQAEDIARAVVRALGWKWED